MRAEKPLTFKNAKLTELHHNQSENSIKGVERICQQSLFIAEKVKNNN